MKKNLHQLALALGAAALMPMGLAQTVLFQDNFDTDSSANWNVFDGSGDGTSDYTVDWAFDFGAVRYVSSGVTNLIPAAPNSGGSKRAVRLTVNNNDETAATAAVNLYPKGQSFSGNYALRFDLWMNYNGGPGGGTGSTEHSIFGLNFVGDKVVWPSSTVTSSDGVFFAVAGEAGGGTVTSDYMYYEGDSAGSPLRYVGEQGGFLDRDGDGVFENEAPGHAPLLWLFPSPPFETPGAPGKQWVQVEVRQRDGLISWLINGYVIAERQSELGWTSGNIMVGLADLFASRAIPPEDNFILIDNLRVVDLGTVPALPRVSVAATSPSAAEPNTHGAFTITREGADLGQPLTVSYRVEGTATPGQDYAAIPLSTNIPAGQAAVTIPVTVIDDARSESTETVRLTLLGGVDSYEVAVGVSAVVEIADDGDVTTVTLAVTDANAFVNLGDTAAFAITRSGDTSGELVVNIATTGTAQAGNHYEALGSSLVIPAGAASINVRVAPQAALDANRTVTVAVSAGAGYTVGAQNSGTVTLRADPARTVFEDSFDAETSANWNVNLGHAESSRANFHWDYSAFGIPPAPNSAGNSTRGLQLKANVGPTQLQTGLSASPKGLSVTGDYKLSFDMWINYNGPLAAGGTGSTMALSGGIGTTGTRAEVPGVSVDSLLFALTGDGGAGNALNPLQPASGVYAAGTQATAINNTDPFYAQFGGVEATPEQLAAYPDQTQATSVGAPGMSWHRFTVLKEGTNVTWHIDDLLIAKVAITNREISTNIFVGFFDINATRNTTASEVLQFGLIDNLKVEMIESAPPAGEVRVTASRQNGSNMEIDFTAPAGFNSFAIESSATVNGPFTADNNAQITTVSGELRRATVPMSGSARFFRVRAQ